MATRLERRRQKKKAQKKRQPGDDLTPEQREALDEVFEMFSAVDEDKSGFLDRKELRTLLYILGMNPTDAEFNNMMEEFDKNGDGGIDREEFTKVMIQYYKDPDDEEEDIREAFATFDKDGSGEINKSELRMVLTEGGDHPMTAAEVDEMFAAADTDGDGYISYEEFVKVMKNGCLGRK